MDGEYGGLGWQPFEEWWEAHLSTRDGPPVEVVKKEEPDA